MSRQNINLLLKPEMEKGNLDEVAPPTNQQSICWCQRGMQIANNYMVPEVNTSSMCQQGGQPCWEERCALRKVVVQQQVTLPAQHCWYEVAVCCALFTQWLSLKKAPKCGNWVNMPCFECYNDHFKQVLSVFARHKHIVSVIIIRQTVLGE